MSSNPRVANSTRYRRAVSKCRARHDDCAICWHSIDYSLKSPDPMSFEADHIKPVSKGGSLYDPSNLQASHRCCNIWRSDKSMKTVDDIMRGAVKPKTPPPIWRPAELLESGNSRSGTPGVVPTFDW